jgi:hypothetical protein
LKDTSVASAAGRPESGAVAPRTPVAFVTRLHATSIAAALVVVWLLVDPHTPDLAAQVYRVGLFTHNGFSVWDNRWYAGHHLPGYSLVFPALGALIGLRTVGALSVILSAALFERTVLDIYGPRARPAAVWFAVAAVGDIWIGRLTFALGVTFALAAVLPLGRFAGCAVRGRQSCRGRPAGPRGAHPCARATLASCARGAGRAGGRGGRAARAAV